MRRAITWPILLNLSGKKYPSEGALVQRMSYTFWQTAEPLMRSYHLLWAFTQHALHVLAVRQPQYMKLGVDTARMSLPIHIGDIFKGNFRWQVQHSSTRKYSTKSIAMPGCNSGFESVAKYQRAFRMITITVSCGRKAEMGASFIYFYTV